MVTSRRSSLVAPSWEIASGIPPMKVKRCGFDSVFFQGKWIVMGGCNDNGKMRSVEVIHLSDDAVAGGEGWQDFPSMDTARHGFGSAIVTCAGQSSCGAALLVAGGYGPLSTVELLLLDSPDQGWKKLPSMKHPRYGCAVASLAPSSDALTPAADESSGRVFVVGGSDHGILHDSVEYCDTADAWHRLLPAAGGELQTLDSSNAWKTLPAMSTGRTFCAAVLLRGSSEAGLRLVVMGGRVRGGSSTASVECFDFSTNQWYELPPMNVPRSQFAAVLVGDNCILAVGGMSPTSESRIKETTLSCVEFFDVSTQQWTLLPDRMTTGRRGCTAVAVGGTHLVVSGGQDANSLPLNSVEVYPLFKSLPPTLAENSTSWSSALPEVPPIPTESGLEARANALDAWCRTAEQTILQLEERKNTQTFKIRACREAEIRAARERFDNERQQAEEKEEQELAKVEAREGQKILDIEERLSSVREELGALRGSQENMFSPSKPPQELVCSITHEVMVDPVMANDGHTYERSAIEKWFEDFPQDVDPTSPNTGLELTSRELIPCVRLKGLCNVYWERNSSARSS